MDQTIFKTLGDHFAATLAKVLSEFAATPWTASANPVQSSDAPFFPALTYKFTLQGDVSGCVYLQLSAESTTRLVAVLLGEPVAAPAEISAEQKEASLELMRSLARKIAEEPNSNMKIEAELMAELSEPAVSTATLTLSGPQGQQAAGRLLAAAKDYPAPTPRQSAAEVEHQTDTPPKINNAAIQLLGINESRLNLVMDVELNVTLRFGQRQLTLCEILELGTGSVVELDRHVEEPVELLLDGKVIARGEAVIVDGNYGLRVSEIAAPAIAQFVR